MIDAIKDANFVYRKVFVKAHSGAICLSVKNGCETWLEINLASPQWFGRSASYGYDLQVRSTPLTIEGMLLSSPERSHALLDRPPPSMASPMRKRLPSPKSTLLKPAAEAAAAVAALTMPLEALGFAWHTFSVCYEQRILLSIL